ncbi:SAM-dependent methyltransferase [Rathayibacter rathayi]|uniref:class I SAM-dependent methyltransferase n=1 Tax=Rathayibacter rathayi TaxID=33887 RepID=UPI000CE8ACB4|nr:class I SAM-dependent methyltransferase [Rathayibacter rathayi]PPF23530.1 SAM-dependent methyltransferase [Rathayibacter rathayi]PPG69483.1 SAM-dependent methyltransferase [Rathayibacter rathayi]PPG77242.1 SAM-dependent methyltransferase [Rathayibacter rathayi]PPG88491.1 SAM-dependent methyltransferase [Rathayibacter rathayi]PPG94794.1 SAM-dependent methyltransferase [Rathayibacter rathayi]
MPIGAVTRGTTGTNRLRRVDRRLAELPVLRSTAMPLVVDLGFGASAVTTLELHRRLVSTAPGVEVLGLDIEPARVDIARKQLARVREGGTPFPADARVQFERGGFEVPLPAGRRASIIRAFNVLRQYDEDAVAAAWGTMTDRLQPDGVLVEGTCDEIGRICTWIEIGREGPRSLTLSLRLAAIPSPMTAAERLPKALIHRNVAGEGVHAFLSALDRAWTLNAPLAVYGPRQRWIAAVRDLRREWPVLGGPRRWRLGEVTVAWGAVAPAS